MDLKKKRGSMFSQRREGQKLTRDYQGTTLDWEILKYLVFTPNTWMRGDLFGKLINQGRYMSICFNKFDQATLLYLGKRLGELT